MKKSKVKSGVKSRTMEIQGIRNGMMRFLVCAMVFLIASAGGYGPCSVGASPDEPIISDGGATVTLSGDQSQGITNVPGWVYSDFFTPPVTTVNILDLTADILNATYPLAAIYIYDAGSAGKDGDGDAYDGDDGKDGSSSSNMTLNYGGGGFSLAPVVPYEGIHIDNRGGSGGDGGQGNSGLAITASGGDGGDGASSGATTLNSNGTIQVLNGVQAAIYVTGNGGGGGDGGAAKAGTAAAHGGDGGNGGAGNNVVVSSSSTIGSSTMAPMIGITAVSKGGSGGDGNDGKTGSKGVGGNGGDGANGAMASVDNSGDISAIQVGISATSRSGEGGAGGLGGGTDGQGGYGGDAGTAGQATVANTGAIHVLQGGKGIDAESIGYAGGKGGEGEGVGGIGHDGGKGGSAGAVDVTNAGAISVQMPGSYGIYALSEAGDGGKGGDGAGVGGKGGDGGIGGSGGTVTINNQADITMLGAKSQGILAASRGGAGGDGGQGDGLVGIGGAGKGSGPGGDVAVDNSGVIQTEGDTSRGIFIQSVGGYGGGSGSSGGFYAYSAGGNSGGDGGTVDLENTGSVTTSGLDSDALFAQSVGGGGGSGGSSGGVIALGGTGSAGGVGGTVAVSNSGTLRTSNDEAAGIQAQSIGGGGGDGGSATSGGLGLSVSLGGSAGSGGDGGRVSVDSANGIDTEGENAPGIFVQSVGGGGGNGGYSVSVSASGVASCSVALGGNGGDGGQGGVVSVDNDSAIRTKGVNAYGILAESVGGGGGVAGYSASVTVSGFSAAIGLGGNGGDGGGAQKVSVASGGDIATYGENAHGILAQSVGGGGGAAGYSASGTLGATGVVNFSMGGSGGGGGNAGQVEVTNDSHISTLGKTASGLLAQSVGGGGGAGALSIGASVGLISGSVSLGGDGGSGGGGNLVGVTNNGDISTAGEAGYGILAQSIGGGGGVAGYSLSEDVGVGALGLAVGGSGNAGGLGGIVNLDNFGDIATQAGGSHGILAQSIGGGGGAGGFAETTALSFGASIEGVPVPSLSLSVATGGSGGPGSDSQKVTVQNHGAIITEEAGSNGIFAQSIGGGGGDGGWSVAAAMSFSEGETYSADIALSHGGTGGSGGKGDETEVVNNGAIHTKSENATGILAQSIGGGGGNGGLSSSVTLEAGTPASSTFASSVSVGGLGGEGGSASRAAVASSADILVEGGNSQGILAQSLGGGGGNGGVSLTGMLGFSKDPVQLGVTVGGSGGGGGGAGSASIESIGSVATAGDQSVGLKAQSIGGGGGNGAISFDGEIAVEEAKSFAVSVGGSGGEGGDGGDVQITAEGAVSTSGSDAHAILAQSVGGGGGVGNFGGTGVLGFHKSEKFSVNLAINVGGSGGAAGVGGGVDVDNQADISTAGENSYGILAQSVGGGGGEAGGGFTGHINAEIPESGFSWELGVSVGGNGGDGNHGGAVQVANEGSISTLGDSSHGIYAQSVGGGGGEGGKGRDFALIISKPEVAPEHITSLAVSLGGKGGGSSNGGAVTVANTGDIATAGAYAKGIFAQSVGGGGGEGGSNKGHTIRDTALPGTLFVSVGGDAGSSGDGGSVSVTNSGAVATSGEGSYGIQAQSVGGGGGVGGEGEVGLLKLAVGIGGAAGAAGDGGNVAVDNSGAIRTAGDGAHGIFAQSVGGGGGEAGCVARFLPEFADIGIGIGWAQDGGAGGDGGVVDLANTSDITTTGASAYGILAQSVGGGGGEAGEVGYGKGSVASYLLGSVGGAGSGGTVNVAHSAGTIATLGDNSAGIFAQSAGGEGLGGAVNIVAGGDVLSSGADSHGIVAQSLGLEGNGNISIAIDSGTVQGGAGGVGVVFMDGAANTLSNSGIITTVDGINGAAVESLAGDGAEGFAGNETVANHGVITGSVDLGEGENAFLNYSGAVFNAGSEIGLGDGNTLANSGTLNVGGGTASQSELTGDFSQSDTGVFTTTLNPDGSCGSLKVSGSADLDGTLELNYGSGAFTTETTYGILTADSIDGEFSQEAFPDDTLLSVSTEYHSTVVDVTVTPESFTTMAQNSHEMLLGQYHDRLLPMTHHDFGDLHGILQTLPASEFRSAFASFSPAIYDANAFTTFDVSRQYLNTVRDRLKKARQNASFGHARWKASDGNEFLASNDSDTKVFSSGSEGLSSEKFRGISLAGFGQFGDADEDDGLSGFDYTTSGAAIGADFALNEQFAAGAGFGYAATNIDLDSNFGATDIDSFFGSVYGTYYTKKFYLEGVFSYGRHSYDNRRRISIGEIRNVAESDYDADAYSAFLEAGYDFSFDNWNLRPFASLLYTHLDEEGFRETGADSLDMHIEDNQTDDLSSELGVRLSRSFEMEKGILTPEFMAAWQKDYDSDRHEMAVSFAGEPKGISVEGRERSDSALLGAGLSFTSHGGVSVSLQYDGEIAEDFSSHSLFGQIRIPF